MTVVVWIGIAVLLVTVGALKWLADHKWAADRLSRICPDCGKLWPSHRALGSHKRAHRPKRIRPEDEAPVSRPCDAGAP